MVISLHHPSEDLNHSRRTHRLEDQTVAARGAIAQVLLDVLTR